tara:strand:- start:325 stop:507 length:183 start_codon:yes stop_codon:yes gene_type:complete
MFSMISGLDRESQKRIVERWTEMIQEAKKKEQRRQAIEILTKSKNISFKDIHIIGKMLQT